MDVFINSKNDRNNKKLEEESKPPFYLNNHEKYNKRMDLRQNKVREQFSKGYSQFEISNMLHISQSTISRDINYMQSKINKGDVDPDDQLLVECEKIMLTLDEMVEELWKIMIPPKQVPKKRPNPLI